MKVAIDSGPLKSGHAIRGVGISVKKLIEAFEKYNNNNNIVIKALDFSSSNLDDFDVIHYTSFNPYFFNHPRVGSKGKKIIMTIHDLIPLIYKNHYPPGVKGELRFQINKIFLKSVDKFICVSETSKKDVVRILNINEKKIDVVYWGVDEIFRKIFDKVKLTKLSKKYNLPNRFILYVGDVNYNKNLSTLIKACKIDKLPLVIVGKQAASIDELINNYSKQKSFKDDIRTVFGKLHPELNHLTELSKLIKDYKVLTTGFVPESDLVGIMNLASVYCEPSLYEGFGMPVLEAFACETPVVISKTQALVEVAGGSAAIANPNSAQDFADKISSLLTDSSDRLRMIREGRKRVEQFSWKETALQTLNMYKSLL